MFGRFNHMKRHPALQNISREHHLSLSLVLQINRAVNAADTTQIFSLVSAVHLHYKHELEAHFEEEKYLFRAFAKQRPEYKLFVSDFLIEHQKMTNLLNELDTSSTLADLKQFADLLKDHTRREERDLFPLIEETLSSPASDVA